MKVFVLRELVNSFTTATATAYDIKLRRQKFGFRLTNTENKILIIDNIIFDNLVCANKFRSDEEEVLIPTWISQDSFNKFISKINQYANVFS
jgi:hypothetical protein